jgi:hypothetical protein
METDAFFLQSSQPPCPDDHREDFGERACQWDCSTELQDAYGSIPGYPLEGSIERNLSKVHNLSPHIPPQVALGYHFCFGTLGGWPRFLPDNLVASSSGRKS